MSYLPNVGVVSTLNSTTTPLAASTTYTGTWEVVAPYASVILAVKTDQIGTAYMDFSPDGTNIDSTLTFNVAAATNEVHRLTVTRKYYRVRFTNSTTDQTYMRLQTIYGNQTALSALANLTIQQDADATIVRPKWFNYEVALSKWVDNTTWNKWGYNADIDTGAAETIWANGGLFARLTSASGITVVSSSANDTSAGTGAQSIIVYSIDENRIAKQTVVTLNGTTPVVVSTGTLQILGINRVAIYLAGSGGVNEGTITITATTGGTTQATIPAGTGVTQQAFFFVQAGHTALLDWLYVNIAKIAGGGTQPLVTTKCWVTSLVSGAKYEVFRDYLDAGVENHNEYKPSQPFVVGEKSLIEFQSETTVNNTGVSIRFSLIEVRTS